MIRTYLYKLIYSSNRVYFFLRLIFIFAILKYSYLFLVAITTPGGIIPFQLSPTINPILNMVQLNQWVVGKLLLLSGYEIRFTTMGVGIKESFGVWIEFPCLGIQVSYAFISLIVAYPGKDKWKHIIIGLFIFQLVNFIRIYLIILAGHQIPNINIGNAHLIYNCIVYSIMLYLFYRYTQKQTELTT